MFSFLKSSKKKLDIDQDTNIIKNIDPNIEFYDFVKYLKNTTINKNYIFCIIKK